MQFELANYGSGKNYANPGRFVMPGEPEGLRDKMDVYDEYA